MENAEMEFGGAEHENGRDYFYYDKEHPVYDTSHFPFHCDTCGKLLGAEDN
jgi:hypothetical protein